MTLFFYGPNTYELRAAVAQMTSAYVAKAGSDFGLERIDGSAATPATLSAALTATPFLATSRLVVIEGLAQSKLAADALAKMLAAIPSTTVAVFVDTKVDQRTAVFKQLQKADKVMKFEALSGQKLLAWLAAEAVRLGQSLEPAVLRALVEAAGDDQWRLSNELHKLVHSGRPVTVELVRELVEKGSEQTIFELVEAMTAGRVELALRVWRSLLERRESEIYVLTMVQWQLRNLLLAKTAPPQMSPADVAKATGMSPYVAGKMAAAQSGVNEQVLRRAFSAAAECEYEIKSGKAKAAPAVERLIYSVAALTARAR